MAMTTAINWADSSWNPWEGCTKAGAGCANCYAEKRDARMLTETVIHWGARAPRRVMADSNWRKPLSWNLKAVKAGNRPRVFPSLCDPFDLEAPLGQRDRHWGLIRATPNLDWLLLTKRPVNIRKMLPKDWGTGYSNVWLGVTVADRKSLPWLDILCDIPAVVRFVSFEPLLEDLGTIRLKGIDWCIIGGESGTGARVFDMAWTASIVAQCYEQGSAPWVKQLGTHPVDMGRKVKLNGAGADMEAWPEELSDLKIRALPSARNIAA